LSATEDRIFTERRILACASTAAIAYVIGLAMRLLQHGWFLDSNGSPKCIDFTTMWVTGIFAASSNPARMYDDMGWSAVWRSVTGLKGCMLAQGHTSYPPLLLFFTYPLGLIDYSTAFVVWMIVTLLFYLAVVYLIIPRSTAVIAALTPFPLIFNVLLGHNGFLTAGLVGLSLLLVERRPRLSGMFLALLAYKPQFGILYPLGLLASRSWPTLTSAAAGSLILGIAAAIIFGYQGWPAFITSLFDRDLDLGQEPSSLVSIFGFLQTTGANTRSSWVVHLAFGAVVMATLCAIWAKPIPHFLKAAALCVGSVIVTPYAFGYDLLILSIAGAFLVSDGLSRGFLPGERTTLVMCWAGLFVLTGPIPALICVVLLVMVIRRALLSEEAVMISSPEIIVGNHD
jgi:hypothetical protein